VGPWLLDVNILLAWLWPKHTFHRDALSWLGENLEQGWASCPFTETGFLRIVSSPSFSPLAPTLAEAHHLLKKQMQPKRGHRFWAADLSCKEDAIGYLRGVTGHQQITDGYLLALAIQNGGCLVTRDRRIRALAPEGSPAYSSLLVLP
jgi:uncharacterized protein